MKAIQQDGRFVTLVTYADESQEHTGTIYRAANWHYMGRTKPTPRWLEPSSGRQVSPKSTVNRTKAQMEALGYVRDGYHHKHKFVLHLPSLRQRATPQPMPLFRRVRITTAAGRYNIAGRSDPRGAIASLPEAYQMALHQHQELTRSFA